MNMNRANLSKSLATFFWTILTMSSHTQEIKASEEDKTSPNQNLKIVSTEDIRNKQEKFEEWEITQTVLSDKTVIIEKCNDNTIHATKDFSTGAFTVRIPTTYRDIEYYNTMTFFFNNRKKEISKPWSIHKEITYNSIDYYISKGELIVFNKQQMLEFPKELLEHIKTLHNEKHSKPQKKKEHEEPFYEKLKLYVALKKEWDQKK